MTVRESGNVGIGTPAPDANLSIKTSNDGYPLKILDSNGDLNAGFYSVNSAGGIMIMYDGSGSEKARIEGRSGQVSYINSGNVGIGTTGPASKLHMSSGVYINDGNSYGLFVGTTTTTNAAARIVGRSGDEYVLKLSSSTGEAAFGLHQDGHLSIYGSAVSLATCANAAVSANSKRDTAFTINFTGANSSCGVNFGSTFDVQPVCVAMTKNTGNNGVEMSQVSVSSVTFIPQTGAWANGDMINVICVGAH
jgi:hypothetical protein